MPEEDLPMERRDEVSRAALERCTKAFYSTLLGGFSFAICGAFHLILMQRI